MPLKDPTAKKLYQTISIDVFPPSVNHYKGMKRLPNGKVIIYRTKFATDWLNYVSALIRSKCQRACLFPIELYVTVDYPRSNFDLDNLLKCILDAVKMSGVVPDDNVECIPRIHIMAGNKVKRGKERVILLISEIDNV